MDAPQQALLPVVRRFRVPLHDPLRRRRRRPLGPLDRRAGQPLDTLPFFGGDLDGAPVYAFYADKGSNIVDLVYFFYYPYNRGKEVVDTIWATTSATGSTSPCG